MKHRFVNIMLVSVLLFVTLFSTVPPVHAAPAAVEITTPAEMEAFLNGVFAAQMSVDHVPGAVVSVVKDGQVFFAKGYGYSDMANQVQVSPDRTLFRIGSVSKLFVWTSVMQLAEQGKLDLNADVNTYLDFKIPSTFPEPITMKNLMTHTPGFEEFGVGLYAYNEDQLISLGDFLKTHIPARVFPPGEVGAYSNYGAALAGYIVERVSGMPFDEYVEKNIFQPLGMDHSTFRQPLPADLALDMSAGYSYIDGEYQQGSFELIPPYPAGSVSATADDMAKFMTAHLQNGIYSDARILSDATAQEMHSQLISYDSRLTDGMAHGFFRQQINGQLVLHHGGDTQFFHTGFYLLPDQNVGIFVSTNSVEGSSMSDVVFKTFMDHYYPVEFGTELVPPSDMASRAAQYTGEYYSSRSNFSTFEKISLLFDPSIQFSVDDAGYVFASGGGETQQFVETEPGVLQSRQNPSAQIAFSTHNNQETYIASALPYASYVKAKWYETQSFHLLLLGVSTFILIFALFGWLGFFFRVLFKRESHPWLSHLARMSGIAFILLFTGFLMEFILLASDMIPVYETPKFIFELPSNLPLVMAIPPIMAVMGILLLVFTPLAWMKRFWTLRGRLDYTLVTLSAWTVIWELAYWNFLKI